MSVKEQLIQGLSDEGCSPETAEKIGTLYEAGSYSEVLHQMKVQRCMLIDEMHKSQRRVDRMDFMIRNQEKQIAIKESEDESHDKDGRAEADTGMG